MSKQQFGGASSWLRMHEKAMQCMYGGKYLEDFICSYILLGGYAVRWQLGRRFVCSSGRVGQGR